MLEIVIDVAKGIVSGLKKYAPVKYPGMHLFIMSTPSPEWQHDRNNTLVSSFSRGYSNFASTSLQRLRQLMLPPISPKLPVPPWPEI